MLKEKKTKINKKEIISRLGAGAASRVFRATGAAGGAAAAAAQAAAAAVLPSRVRHAARETHPQAEVARGSGRAAETAPRVAPGAGAGAPGRVSRQVPLVPPVPAGRAAAATGPPARRLLQPGRAVLADDGAGHQLSAVYFRFIFDRVRVGQCPIYVCIYLAFKRYAFGCMDCCVFI